jgi:TolB-like protein
MTEPDPSPDKSPSGLAAFWQELKRRKVMRVAITYAVVAWVIMQVSSIVFPQFDIPVWAGRLVTLILVICFPISLIIAWAFELSPDGIKTTKHAREEQGEAPVSEYQERKRNWMAFAFAAAVPTLIFGTLALIFFFRSSPVASAPSPLASSPSSLQVTDLDKSIAVLPLTNMSPDAANAFFADGVHEDILSNLSKVRELFVISRTSTLQYRNTVKTMKEIGAELGVRYLVEGSVRKAGDQVLVTVQLIDSQNDQHLWAENYDRKLDDIFAIQAAVAKDIAGQLQAVLSPEEIEQIDYRPTENQEAYGYYVQARQTGVGSGNRLKKIELVEKAVRLDPDFVEAWSYLAQYRIFHWRDEESRRQNTLLLHGALYAFAEVERLSSGSALGLYTRSFLENIGEDDADIEIDLLSRALVLDPNFLDAKTRLGRRFLINGSIEEARTLLEEAQSPDPFNGANSIYLSFAYQRLGLWDQDRALLEKSISPKYFQQQLARSNYLETGDMEVLKRELQRLDAEDENPNRDRLSALILRDYSVILNYMQIEPFAAETFRFPFGLSMGQSAMIGALVYFELGDREKWLIETKTMKTYLEEYTRADPLADPFTWSQLPMCYALEGDRSRMEAGISAAREKVIEQKRQYTVSAQTEAHIATAYLILGDTEKAIDILEAACRQDSLILLNREIGMWFIFDRLRGNPRFDKLLED